MNAFSWYINRRNRTLINRLRIILYLIGSLGFVKLGMHPIYFFGAIAAFFFFMELRKNINANLTRHIEYMLAYPFPIDDSVKMEYDAIFWNEYRNWMITGTVYLAVYSLLNKLTPLSIIANVVGCVLMIPIMYEVGALYSYGIYNRLKEIPLTICIYMIISVFNGLVMVDARFVFLAFPIYAVLRFFRKRMKIDYSFENSKE